MSPEQFMLMLAVIETALEKGPAALAAFRNLASGATGDITPDMIRGLHLRDPEEYFNPDPGAGE